MAERFCIVDEVSPERARRQAARELGTTEENLVAEAIGPGQYRVTLVRASSTIEVDVTHDGMEAHVTLITPPIGDAPPPTRADVVRALEAHGVVRGLDMPAIDALVQRVVSERTEARDIVVARGLVPIPGAPGQVMRRYARPTDAEPERSIRIVREGEVLIELARGRHAEPGFTVTGETVLPSGGVQSDLVVSGSGIAVDEAETLRWIASVPGFGYLRVDPQAGPCVEPAVTIDPEGEHAYLMLEAPGADEPPITRAELDTAIRGAGVVHGIMPDRVDAAFQSFAEQGTLPRPVRIADATPPTPGADAGIEFAIDVSKRIGDVEDNRGQIDYRERHGVHNVQAHEVIATWVPPQPGTDGVGVDGRVIPAPKGQEGVLSPGDNIETEERPDGRILLRAAIDGMLQIKAGNVISVVDLLVIPGDVDFEVGNIDATGSVIIKGTVRSGFRVTAARDITVQECIEDAIVEAGGSVLVKQGIIGTEDGGGRVRAGTQVVCNYAQHARIYCDGDVEIRDSDTNSIVECRGKLIATDGHGRLMGGKYTAAQGVEAREIGSDFGAPTQVIVGYDPELEPDLRRLHEELTHVRAQQAKIHGTLAAAKDRVAQHMTPALAEAVRKLVKARKDLGEQEVALGRRLAELEDHSRHAPSPTVTAQHRAFYGVDIYIRGARYHTDEIIDGVTFALDAQQGEIHLRAAAE